VALALKADFPEVEQVARFHSRPGQPRLEKATRTATGRPHGFTDNHLQVLHPARRSAARAARPVVVINERTAEAFNTTNTGWQVLTVDTALYKVTGVIKYS